MTWTRPVPLIGDRTSAAERASDPQGWAFPAEAIDNLYDVVNARRDVRRYRANPVDDSVLARVLQAAHAAPSVGHSQPWRFVIVADPVTRDRAAWLADRERLAQAAQMDEAAAAHLLDLQLEGIREAPLGIVVCCDRRTPPAGVLGRATFSDSDMWSCACAIENLWLAARAEGLGVGWVTLFQPDDLAELIGIPDGVTSLGWLCVGWPDERPPAPGLERAAWSHRLPLDDVVMHERWPAVGEPASPASRLRGPDAVAVVDARDEADTVLTSPGSLGVLDDVVDRVISLGHAKLTGGTLLLAVGRHPVTELGVSAYESTVTDEVLAAARAGEALGVAAATAIGLAVVIADGGTSSGNLRDTDALAPEAALALVAEGRRLGQAAGKSGLVALGEVGIGNTTVAAALVARLLGLPAEDVVGRGAAADSAMVERKCDVVRAALKRTATIGAAVGSSDDGSLRGRDVQVSEGERTVDLMVVLGQLGGPEFALLAGVATGAAEVGAVVVIDGLATSVAALIAVMIEPAVARHLVAGQRSRETAHAAVLMALGLEPLLDLRIRAGEGAGAVLATGLILQGLTLRRTVAQTAP